MNDTHRLVQRLWALCGVLRDDGIAYHQYVDELSYLLFLKLRLDEQGDGTLVDGQVWEELTGGGPDALQAYKKALGSLARSEDGGLQLIFQGATTSLRREESLRRLVEGLDALRLQGKGHQALGDLYEGLLQKNAAEKKSGAGQYFTPRPLVEVLVELIQPRPEEVVSDPAAGTLGFLTCANAYIQRTSSDGRGLSPESYGVELVPDTCRVARMNAHLHGLQGRVLLGDTLAAMGIDLPPSDVILT
ncbi:MAG: N-6 DNA methylase, partial [Myxococcota bacterium]|nr:N-6 DNA methylase [Myxococcota bacterium]